MSVHYAYHGEPREGLATGARIEILTPTHEFNAASPEEVYVTANDLRHVHLVLKSECSANAANPYGIGAAPAPKRRTLGVALCCAQCDQPMLAANEAIDPTITVHHGTEDRILGVMHARCFLAWDNAHFPYHNPTLEV